MRVPNQEISFEVAAGKAETVEVKTLSTSAPLPPLTPEQRQRQHCQDALNSAKTSEERIAILTEIEQKQGLPKLKQTAEEKAVWDGIKLAKRIPTNQSKKGKKKKQRKKPLTILQCLRFKTGAKYDLLAAERIVSHICRRQGNERNQAIQGCFESVPNMAKACRIRIGRFRRLLDWLIQAGIVIAEYRLHRSTKYTVAPGRQMIMPMIIDDLKLTPAQSAIARIMLRYGIISIRQAAKLANASARTAARTAKILEEKQVVTVRKTQGCANVYQFCHKVTKFLKSTVAKRARGLLPKRPPLRNYGGESFLN